MGIRFLQKLKKKFAFQIGNLLCNILNSYYKQTSISLFEKIPNKPESSKFWGRHIIISDPTKIIIGKNVHLGDHAFIKSEGGLTIGDNTHISRNLVLYTMNHHYAGDIIPYNSEMTMKPVSIGKNVWIGMNVCITPGSYIGDGCIIGMGTVVSGHIPALSIVGPQKWTLLKTRDVQAYEMALSKQRFAKEDGLLYTENPKELINLFDTIVNERTSVEIIDWQGNFAIKKSFEENEQAQVAYQNEMAFYNHFKKYKWLPKVYDVTRNSIVYEFFDPKFRLDLIFYTLNAQEKKQALGMVISCLLDMYAEKYLHQDLHSRNLFLTPQGLKIIDFETSMVTQINVDFFESYDVSGENGTSLFKTNSMCLMANHPSSVKVLFQIKNLDDLKKRVQDYFTTQITSISTFFFTRKNGQNSRHNLLLAHPYANISLKHLQISTQSSQRNIAKRIEQFQTTIHQIQNKSVLDIGCHYGALIFELSKMNPKSLMGVDLDEEKIEMAKRIKALNLPEKDIRFYQLDVEDQQALVSLQMKFDIVFSLSLVGHLKYQKAHFKILSLLCAETIYLEGNSNTSVDFIQIGLQEAGFKNVQHLGFSNDEKNKKNNIRPLFRAHK